MLKISQFRLTQFRDEFSKVYRVLEDCEVPDKNFSVSSKEFKRRQDAVFNALEKEDIEVGFVFCDEHYCGDVPYLGGNTNITVEQVAGIIGKTGFHIIAGLEGGYVAEQLSPRSGSKVHKVEILQLADEKYPIKAEKMEDVLREANAGKQPKRVGLLTPRQVIPAGIIEYLNKFLGHENIVDCQEVYYKIKNEKSDEEMELIKSASLIANVMMKGMLAVLKPGMLETQVAGWGYLIAKELGSEENGMDVMVTSGESNRTLIGKALNMEIKEGDYVHIGVAPKKDGLNACLRRSVIAVDNPSKLTKDQRYWFQFIEEAFDVGFRAYCKVAREELPPKEQEQALINYFRSRTDEVNRKLGLNINDLSLLKPYTGTHNAGYTECQEFYGAITLDSEEPLGNQIVTMLDVAIRGIGNSWNEVIIPDLDFVVIENTLGKFGKKVIDFNEEIPRNVQNLVGGRQYK